MTRLPIFLTALLPASALAQISSPPPGPREPLPPYESQYVPPARSEQPEPELESIPDELPADLYDDVEYESIVKRDADGRIVRYRQPVLAALRATPVIPDEMWPVFEEILSDRDSRAVEKILANPRATVRVRLGALDELDIADQASITETLSVTLPLNADRPLLAELLELGVIDQPTGALTGRIYTEYQTAVFDEIDASHEEASSPPAQSDKAIFMIGSELGETLDAYDRLAIRLLDDPEAAFSGLGFEAPEGLGEVEGRDDAEAIEAATRAISTLDDDQLAALLTKLSEG